MRFRSHAASHRGAALYRQSPNREHRSKRWSCAVRRSQGAFGHIFQGIGLVEIDLHHARLNDVEKLLCHSNHRLALGAARLKRRPSGVSTYPFPRLAFPIVRGFEFRASGRQPIDLGWRAAFPDWKPADENGDEAQLLPPLRNGETAQLHDPKIEDKETRPPPRYNEGTLIEAMQNAWRFVDDEVLRDRLKEAKGIGTPATRAEIIGGLKKQGFLIAQGKHIVPTEAGLSLFGVLKQADPALVDPGVTAQLECLLDEVVVGKQEMVGAIDAVCSVAERIIGKLKDGATAGGPPVLGAAVGNGPGTFPPTPAMKRFADSLARQKGIKPPPGYKASISICRKFLNEHVPKKADGETPGKFELQTSKPGTDVVRQEDRAEKRRRHSRGGQGQLGCHVRVDRLERRPEAPQARSQDRLQAGRVSSASTDRDDEEVSETQSCRCGRSSGSRAPKFGYRYAAKDSLWQQGDRSAWRPLSLGRLVCPTWS